MMDDLFPKSGLQQDTGLLAPRWAQEGRTPISFTSSKSSTGTSYTVTAGKKFYMTNLSVGAVGTGGDFGLLDGSGGSQRFATPVGTAGSSVSYFFDTPLLYDVSVYFGEGGACSVTLSASGWEEKE